MTERAFTVKQVTERYGVGEHTVLGWIHRGELHAIDVSRSPGGKPRWRITPEALEVFETARMHAPPALRTRRRRRHPDVIEFY